MKQFFDYLNARIDETSQGLARAKDRAKHQLSCDRITYTQLKDAASQADYCRKQLNLLKSLKHHADQAWKDTNTAAQIEDLQKDIIGLQSSLEFHRNRADDLVESRARVQRDVMFWKERAVRFKDQHDALEEKLKEATRKTPRAAHVQRARHDSVFRITEPAGLPSVPHVVERTLEDLRNHSWLTPEFVALLSNFRVDCQIEYTDPEGEVSIYRRIS